MSDNYDDYEDYEDEYIKRRRRRRRAERRMMRRRKRAIRIILTRWVPFAIACILLIFLSVTGIKAGIMALSGVSQNTVSENEPTEAVSENTISENTVSENETVSEDAVSENEIQPIKTLGITDDTTAGGIPGEVVSEHAVLISLSENRIIAGRDYRSRINPASMTKVLTVLVAAEQMQKNGDTLDTAYTIDYEIENFSYVNECSNVGFSVGEVVTLKDLFYGTILPSGGDAAYALARYAGGSMEGFADLMNQKLAELGCSETAHFTNSIGLYDENHYCTTYDMAEMINAAMQNELCREVLSTHVFTTSGTPEHPEGIEVSNWFLRRIEDKDCGGKVIAAKTGFVVQSKNCAVSYAEDNYGNPYICVTAGSSSAWRCIYDHVAIYKKYLK